MSFEAGPFSMEDGVERSRLPWSENVLSCKEKESEREREENGGLKGVEGG